MICTKLDRDLTNMSSRLRMKAIEIIMNRGRPISVAEIKQFIRDNDSLMWQDVSDKCDDYIRVILSLTKKTLIARYKPMVLLKGIDRRTTFYGLAYEKYPTNIWRIIEKKNNSEKPQNTLPIVKDSISKESVPLKSVSNNPFDFEEEETDIVWRNNTVSEDV